jgi:hypothetical protein
VFVIHYYVWVSPYLCSHIESSAFILFQLVCQDGCALSYTPFCKEILTVTAEKETKHNAANRKKNIPPSEVFSDSSNSWIYLKQ